MLIYIVSTVLLGALSTVRSADDAGCWLTVLQSAGPVWFAHLKTGAAKLRLSIVRCIARSFKPTPPRTRRVAKGEHRFKRTTF